MTDPSPGEHQPSVDWINQLRQSYSRIQLGPGVVGKTSRAALGLLAAWGIVLFRLGTDLVMNFFLLGGGVVATLAFCWWVRKTHDFAQLNPQVALLEGAELIEYQKWQAEVNGKAVGNALPIPSPDAPLKIE